MKYAVSGYYAKTKASLQAGQGGAYRCGRGRAAQPHHTCTYFDLKPITKRCMGRYICKIREPTHRLTEDSLLSPNCDTIWMILVSHFTRVRQESFMCASYQHACFIK